MGLQAAPPLLNKTALFFKELFFFRELKNFPCQKRAYVHREYLIRVACCQRAGSFYFTAIFSKSSTTKVVQLLSAFVRAPSTALGADPVSVLRVAANNLTTLCA